MDRHDGFSLPELVFTMAIGAGLLGWGLPAFRDVQRDYPSIDGVLAITHKSGCGTKLFGEDHQALQPMYFVELVKDPDHDYPIPKLIAELSPEETAPPVNVPGR